VNQKFSFPQRLHRREEFERVLQLKGLNDSWLALHSESNTTGTERLGIVVSKRVVAKAVARNRIKRMIREVFRQSCSNTVSALNIVVRVRKSPGDEDAVEFRRSLSRLLTKVRMQTK
jgi:ribonuclease P protein component